MKLESSHCLPSLFEIVSNWYHALSSLQIVEEHNYSLIASDKWACICTYNNNLLRHVELKGNSYPLGIKP